MANVLGKARTKTASNNKIPFIRVYFTLPEGILKFKNYRGAAPYKMCLLILTLSNDKKSLPLQGRPLAVKLVTHHGIEP